MGQDVSYRDYIPESCEGLLEKSTIELRTELPKLARDEKRMNEIEASIREIDTDNKLVNHDARDLSKIDDESIELVVTSPPYFNIKSYDNGTGTDGQLGNQQDYQEFNEEIDRVWKECYDKLVPGGRMCVVVGDVLRSRSEHGRHRVIPLHATIQEHCIEIGFDNLAPIIWYKIGNASLEAGGNARFLGKPYEPGAVIKNDIEYILLFRKPGGYRSPTTEERILSMIESNRHKRMFRQIWDDISGESRTDHPAPYPVDLAERLVRMFSFVGDRVLDPFAGTGTTAIAASEIGRHTYSVELEEEYFEIAQKRLNEKGRQVTLPRYSQSVRESAGRH